VGLYLERFIIPVMAGIVVALVTKQFRVQMRYRLLLIIGVAGIGYLAARTVQNQQDSKNQLETPRSTNLNQDQIGTGDAGIVNAGTQSPVSHVNGEPAKLGTDEMFIHTYVATEGTASNGAARWAVVLADPDGDELPGLNSTANDLLRQKGYLLVPIFRPDIKQRPNYDYLYSANAALLTKLNHYCDGMIVGKLVSRIEDQKSIEGLVSAHVSLEVRVLSARQGTILGEFRIDADGAGFAAADAAARAQQILAPAFRQKLATILDRVES
jgi:hypothetical protein